MLFDLFGIVFGTSNHKGISPLIGADLIRFSMKKRTIQKYIFLRTKNLSSAMDERLLFRGTFQSLTRLGGPEGTRTPDLLHAIETLYQLRYRPIEVALCRIGTCLGSALDCILYRMSSTSAL